MFILVATKGDVLYHHLFIVYKPDPFGLTTHFRPAPSCRLSSSWISIHLQFKVRKTAVASPHPPVAKIWINLVLTVFYFNEFPNFVWESGRHQLPPRLTGYQKGLGLYIVKRECDIKHPPFVFIIFMTIWGCKLFSGSSRHIGCLWQ